MARNAARFARPLARPPAARFSRSLEGLPAARFARRLTAPPHPLDGAPDLVERFGILERREVAGILAERSGPDGAPDDLRAPSLGQRGDKDHTLGPEGLPELVRRRASDLGSELLGGRESGPKGAEDPGDLALHFVRDADGGGLGDGWVRDRGGLDLGGPDALAGDVQRVVGAAVEEPVAVLVHRGPVAVRPDPREAAPVRVQVALRVAPETAGHARERFPADKLADLAANRVALGVDDVDRHAE